MTKKADLVSHSARLARTKRPAVLVVAEDPEVRRHLADALAFDGSVSVEQVDGAEAVALGKRIAKYDVVVSELELEDGHRAVDLMDAAGDIGETGAQFVVFAESAPIEACIEAMQRGVLAYATGPVNAVEIRAHVARAIERADLVQQNEELRRALDERFGLSGIIGDSPAMRRVFDVVRAAAPTDASVLILGENGTGKELIARCLHQTGPRRDGPFVAINCAAIAETLLESELFGHTKGAFTGATSDRIGKFEAASTGTLYLDEVGDMPMTTQIKLLRVLEAREITRIGSNTPTPVDIRLIASTNRKLSDMVDEGSFREDLLHRLKVVTIDLPPLRERPSDIPLLIDHFLRDFAKHHGKAIEGLTPEARQVLASFAWPGNVRQLRNTIETMVVLGRGPTLGVSDVPADIRGGPAGATSMGGLAGRKLEEVERTLIEQTLELTDGNREEAAKLIGMGERTLYRKIRKYGLGKKD